MKTRSVEAVLAPREPHFVGDGFRVHNFIPSGFRLDMERMTPFIMLDYGSKYYFPPALKPKGVGVHPHRGFETVTLAYKGKVAHRDSAGNSGIIEEGDVQWMTAGSGILHNEFHEESFSRKGGDFQMVQLWVNLPAKDKMAKPKYQAITNTQIKKVQLPDGGGVVEVIAGQYKGITGSATTFTPVCLYNVRLNENGKASLAFPSEFNTGLLVIEGRIQINKNEIVHADHFVLFQNNGEEFTIDAFEKSVVLVLSGQPINEPIAAQGPFVMNTQEELVQAIGDFHAGKFGQLQD